VIVCSSADLVVLARNRFEAIADQDGDRDSVIADYYQAAPPPAGSGGLDECAPLVLEQALPRSLAFGRS
jgi:hypothetical protein